MIREKDSDDYIKFFNTMLFGIVCKRLNYEVIEAEILAGEIYTKVMQNKKYKYETKLELVSISLNKSPAFLAVTKGRSDYVDDVVAELNEIYSKFGIEISKSGEKVEIFKEADYLLVTFYNANKDDEYMFEIALPYCELIRNINRLNYHILESEYGITDIDIYKLCMWLPEEYAEFYKVLMDGKLDMSQFATKAPWDLWIPRIEKYKRLIKDYSKQYGW